MIKRGLKPATCAMTPDIIEPTIVPIPHPRLERLISRARSLLLAESAKTFIIAGPANPQNNPLKM